MKMNKHTNLLFDGGPAFGPHSGRYRVRWEAKFSGDPATPPGFNPKRNIMTITTALNILAYYTPTHEPSWVELILLVWMRVLGFILMISLIVGVIGTILGKKW